MKTESIIHVIKALTTPIIAGIALVQGFKILLYILSGSAKCGENIQILIVGFISGSVLGLVLAFYFGSSFSSKNAPINTTQNGNNNEKIIEKVK